MQVISKIKLLLEANLFLLNSYKLKFGKVKRVQIYLFFFTKLKLHKILNLIYKPNKHEHILKHVKNI